MFSEMVPAKRFTSWLTTPMPLRRLAWSIVEMSTPPISIVPDHGLKNRWMRENMVDLPLPEGPTKAIISPDLAVIDTPWITSFLP